jgi:site-specific DNA-methyltransferase (adenine-specific)
MNLINGDCLEVLPTLAKKSVDMVLVDLPYGQTKLVWDTPIDLDKMWVELKRVCKGNATIVFFTTTKFGHKLIASKEKWFRYDLVWEKHTSVGYLSANRAPLRTHEMIYVFGNQWGGNKTYNSQKTPGKPYDHPAIATKTADIYGETKLVRRQNITGDRHPLSIQKFKCNGTKSLHPTQKPIDACEWLIKSYSNEGDTVLDFTMGSGSTGVACKNTNRKFIGIEKDEEIFKTAEKRINNLS